MLKNHHVLESKVAVAQVAQEAQVARERPGGLREARRRAHALKAQAGKVLAEKAHGAKGAGLREARRTAHRTAHALKALAEKVLAGKALAEKDHGAKGADLRVARRTAHELKAQAERAQAERE